jgi:hypothetical protein
MTDFTPDLQAICDACLNQIADGDGHVWVDQDAAHKANRKKRGLDDDLPIDAADIAAATDAGITWHTTHNDCAPATPSWAYAIPVERINTWPAFIHWTAHLMGKGWVEVTDWDMLIHRAVNPHHATVSGLRPIRPQDLEFRGIGL